MRGIFVHVGVTRDRHRHLDRLDGLVTVRHVEGHVLEVRVRVGELVVGKTHVGGAGILAGGRGRAAEREVGFGIEGRIGIGNHIVRNRMFRTVIRTGVVVTRNRHHGVHLVDGEAAVGDVEDHIVNVCVDVGKLRGGKAHRIDTGIGLVQRCLSVEREVILGIGLVFRRHNLHVVANHAVRLRVVVGCGGMSGDVHDDRSFRHNPQPAIHLREGDLVVRIVVAELRQVKRHRIGRIAGGTARALSDGVTRVHHMGDIVVGIGSHHRVAGHRLLRAGVGLHRGIAGHRHRDADRGDGERADLIGHIVVALLGRAGRGDGVGAGILAGGTAQRVADCILGIAVHETCHHGGEGRIGRAERLRLVVGLHYRVRTGDGELGRVVRHRVVALHGRANRSDHIFADILTRGTAQRVGNDAGRIAVLQARHRGGEGGIGGAVRLRLGIGIHEDGSTGDGEFGRVIRHRVVALLGIAGRGDDIFADILARSTAQRVGNDAGRIAVLQTGHGSREGRIGFTIDFRLGDRLHIHSRLVHVDRHRQFLLAAVRLLGAGRREGHGVVTRRSRRAGKGVRGGIERKTCGKFGKFGVRQRGMATVREHHRGDCLTVSDGLLKVVIVICGENHLRIDGDRE